MRRVCLNATPQSLQICLTFLAFFRGLEKSTTLAEPLDPTILQSMQEGAPQALTGVPKRPAQQNDAVPRVPPKWLKHDRQVS